jgi:hypothetical protein
MAAAPGAALVVGCAPSSEQTGNIAPGPESEDAVEIIVEDTIFGQLEPVHPLELDNRLEGGLVERRLLLERVQHDPPSRRSPSEKSRNSAKPLSHLSRRALGFANPSSVM